MKRKLLISLLSIFWLSMAGCSSISIPNLEAPACTEARIEIKQFYSFHFANDMKFSPENLKQREKFLSRELYDSLKGRGSENDPFTIGSMDFPKAFRLGACKSPDDSKAIFEVLFFWKDDNRSEQKAIELEALKQGNSWLVNKISN